MEKAEAGLWKVVHKAFVTDDVRYTSSVVRAKDKDEAIQKFNSLAKDRTVYPYCWNQVSAQDVYPLTVIE